MPPANDKKSSVTGVSPRPAATAMVENVIKCKWSLTVLHLVQSGVRRPGAMERSTPGLTTKVLNERLRKLVRYGVLARKAYPELPPRVEYSFTPFGRKFAAVLRAIASLEPEVARMKVRPK